MTKFVRTILFTVAISLLTIGVFPVAAQIKVVDKTQCGKLDIACGETAADLVKFIWTAVNVFLLLAAIVAAIFLIIAGVRFIAARGSVEEAETAKRSIIYAIIGLIVIGLSALLVNFVIGAIPKKDSQAPTVTEHLG